MKIGVPLTYSGTPDELVTHARAYEEAGVDIAFLPEAYSLDSVSQLGFLAAKTSRIELGTSIINVFSRTPALIAMTAAGLDHVSSGRFNLGIGASGPQVVEGFHGVPFKRALGRTRELVAICRTVWRRDALVHDGPAFQIPLGADRGGSGMGKPLKLINAPFRERIPITLAALGEKSIELAAEICDGWHPIFYLPEAADAAFGAALERGFKERDPSLDALDIIAETYLRITDDPHERATAIRAVREHVALYVGGMGARGKNFYTDLIGRFGYQEIALEIQDHYLSGRRDEAARIVPEDLVLGLALIGSESEVRARGAAFAAAGVTTLNARPVASDAAERFGDVALLRKLTS